MEIRFQKMNGAGNDFVMIDNQSDDLDLTAAQIRWLCDRRRGIGADGVIVVEPEASADFRMRYYNADGGEAEMCGNGARCVALFARDLGLGSQDNGVLSLHFLTSPGPMEARVREGGIAISMTDATGFESNISLDIAPDGEIVHFVNSGVPHTVLPVPEVDSMPAEELIRRGRAVRYHDRFSPDGCNANFVTVARDGRVHIRTYERGVEDETLACGTGSVASAVVLAHLGQVSSPVVLLTRGGEELTVAFEKTDGGARNVVMEGPAAYNFRGSVQIPD